MLADLPLRPFNMDESSNQHRLRRKIALDATAAQPCAFLLLLLIFFSGSFEPRAFFLSRLTLFDFLLRGAARVFILIPSDSIDARDGRILMIEAGFV